MIYILIYSTHTNFLFLQQLKERFMEDFERDPLFKMDDIHDISKDELRERTMEKV